MTTFQKWLVAVVVIIAGACHTPGQTFEPVATAELNVQLQTAVEEEGLVGLVWTTVTPKGVASGAVGLADANLVQPLTIDSKVQPGSIVKTFIAAAVLRLVTENRLALDSLVTTILPELKFDNRWAPTHPVLVRHLLDHTSGLDDARLWQLFSLKASANTPLSHSIPPDALRIRSRPGSRLSYSNQGYTLLGMVIERVTGERYEQYLDSNLLRPLGMQQSSFRFLSQQGPDVDARLAMGHFDGGVTQVAVPLYLRPAGQFTTTAPDMARFARFLMSNGVINGTPFITSHLLRAMGRPTATEAALAGLVDAGYGLGLNSRDRFDVIGNCHIGTTIGFRANFCLFPDEQKAFFVAMNADVETANYTRFDELLIRQLNLATETRVAIAAPPDAISDWQGIYVLAPARTESFAYLDRVLNFATLRWDGQQLHLWPFPSTKVLLSPVDGWLFRADDRVGASHVLLVTDDAHQVISDGFRSYERVSLWRMLPLWVSLIAGIVGLAWLILAGTLQMLRQHLRHADPLVVPFVAAVALFSPVPLFFAQSFLQLGDLTPASMLLALVSTILPLAMVFGLWRCRAAKKPAMPGVKLAMFAVLQWCAVLAYWELLPLRLWV